MKQTQPPSQLVPRTGSPSSKDAHTCEHPWAHTRTHSHTGPTVFSVILKKMKPETLVSSGIFISAPLPSVEIKKTVFCAKVLADPWEA